MPVIPRGPNKGLLLEPLPWLAVILIVVLIGYGRVTSQGGPPAIGANKSQPLSAALSPAATGLAASREGGPAFSSGRPTPASPTGVVRRPTPGAPWGPSNGLTGRATPATTAEAHSLSVAPMGAPSLAMLPPPNSNPALLPGVSSSIAGITVTGIAGGRVRVAVVEIGGLSSVVSVGDRIRDFTVVAISANEVVLRRDDRTFRLPLARARTFQTTTGGGAPAVAIPAAAAPASPAGTPIIGLPPLPEQPTAASQLPQPPTAPVTSVNLGPTAYPQQTAVPVWGVPLTPAPPAPPVTPPGATLYTPSGTSVYGFTSPPITTQSAVTRLGATALPVASNQVQPAAQVLSPGATLYTPSGTSVYGFTSAPITTQSAVTLRGATALPVASNQAQSVAQVLPWPTYRVEVGPISDRQGAKEIAESLVRAGFKAKVEATTVGQYTVTLTPPPQSTVARGLAIVKSAGADLPIKIELVP